MKGVTYLIIMSVVWSIISSIIEKRKANAKKAAQQGIGVSTQQPNPQILKVDPVTVKVESLRRRHRQQPQVVAQQNAPKSLKPQKNKTLIKSLESLHIKDCPLPAPALQQRRTSPSKQLALMLKNKHNLRTAMVLSEILYKPISQR